MLFRYDFADKLDLTNFEKQVPNHLGRMGEIDYLISLLHFKIHAEISCLATSTQHHMTLWIEDVVNSDTAESPKYVIPSEDIRFQEMEFFKTHFEQYAYKAFFTHSSITKTTHILVELIRLLHKFNSLISFL